MWTQEDLARRVGVAELSVRRWEAGQSIPQPAQLRRLCELFKAAPAELGFPVMASPPRAYSQHSVTTPELAQLLVPSDDDRAPAVRRSQERWHEIRRYLAQHGADLVAHARDLYEPRHFIGSSDAFAHPDWIVPAPIDIRQFDLAWTPSAPPPSITGTEPEARLCLPLHSPGHQYDRYSTAVRHLDRPRLFENRLSYRLYSYERGAMQDAPTMRFGLGTYFDKVDISETLVHEYAVASLDRQRRGLSLAPMLDELPFRALVGDPFGLKRRPVLPGVLTLTLRRSPSGAAPSMLLHLRDPAQVAIGGRVHTLIPSGEFQPASIAPASMEADLNLWRNMVREYSEELLDMPEHDGSHGTALDYAAWPLYRMLTAAQQDGGVRVFFLGIACNPLSLGADLLTAAVFDDETFESAFATVRRSNSEGAIVTGRPGKESSLLLFDTDTVNDLLDNHRLAPSSAACLILAWEHRAELLDL